MKSNRPRPTLSVRLARMVEIATIQRIGIEADARYQTTAHPECADGLTIPTEVAQRAITEGRILIVHAAQTDGALGWALTGYIDGEFCLGQIAVLPAYGQLGAGSLLLIRVIEKAKSQGATSVVLNTQRDIPWCAPWYEAFDFRIIAPADWSPALAKLSREQENEGLNWKSRVHMRLCLLSSTRSAQPLRQ
jgi:GNAT superfamily N-acetyltransferase